MTCLSEDLAWQLLYLAVRIVDGPLAFSEALGVFVQQSLQPVATATGEQGEGFQRASASIVVFNRSVVVGRIVLCIVIIVRIIVVLVRTIVLVIVIQSVHTATSLGRVELAPVSLLTRCFGDPHAIAPSSFCERKFVGLSSQVLDKALSAPTKIWDRIERVSESA